MKTIILLVCLLIAAGLQATSLPEAKHLLSGRVTSAMDNTPLEYATISAYGPDSNLVDGTISDAEGYFELQLPKAEYRIKVEFIGLEAQEVPIQLQANLELPTIALSSGNINLETIEVRADKTDVNLQLNKKIFNVGKDALAQGGSATQVLEQLPSVEVSVDGQVSLRGNTGVRVLINGRPSALADNNALENISADQIESVEIITNPSARYEASGSAGIINIVLKKGIDQGYGGTVNLSTGLPNDHRAGVNLNIRRDKFSAFGSIGLRLSNYRGSGDLVRTSSLSDNFSQLERTIDMRREDRNIQGFGGLDYFINDNTTFTFSYSIYHVANDDQSTINFDLFDNDRQPTESWNQFTDYLEPGTYQQIDFSLVKKLPAAGEKLTFYFKNDLSNEEENEDIRVTETFPTTTELVRYRTNTIEGNRDHLLQGDYERKVGNYGQLEVGLRGETRVISADYTTETPVADIWTPLSGFNNEFDYYESVGAVYGQYGWKRDGLGFQIGLRNEYTAISVENADENEADFKKNYNRLFPSFSAQFEMTDAQSLQLSYSRRIWRPRFWQLNPFAGIQNPTRLFRGNPDINPSFTDRIELTYLYRADKLTINPSVYYSVEQSAFAHFFSEEAGNVFGLNSSTFTETPLNIPRDSRYGIELNTTYRPFEVLSINTTINYYGFTQEGQFEDQSFDISSSTLSGRLRTSLDLGKTAQFTVSANYRAPIETTQQLSRSQFIVDFGGSKRWGERITLSANVRSPRYFESVISRPGFSIDEYFQWTGWRASLSFQYRFEKGAGSDERRQRGSIR